MDNFNNSSPTVTNCTFSGNEAGDGGGMCNYDSSSTVTNCTFSGNDANSGGGMYNATSDPNVTNCIFWGNSDSGGTDESAQIHGGTPDVNYCCIEGLDTFAGGGNINNDPLFRDVDLRLSSASPCIDAGDNTAVPGAVATDLDGHLRRLDGDCNGIEVVDMGAYEFAWAYIGDFDYQCDVDLVDFAIFALAWLTEPGDWDYLDMFDISIPQDRYIDWRDLGVIAENWMAGFCPGCDGQPCTEDTDCISGHCANGFCCQSGQCCNVADDCYCTGSPWPCDAFGDQYSCEGQSGCYWEAYCDGPYPWCSGITDPYDCEGQGCFWVDNGCLGTADECYEIIPPNCEVQEGCELEQCIDHQCQ